MRILHLASSERWTGLAEPAATLALEEIQQGHEVQFACIPGSSFERRLQEMGIPFAPGFQFDRRLGPANFRADVRRLRQLVVQWKPQIVHCHLPHDHWIAALALRRPLSRFLRQAPAIVRTVHRDAHPRHDLAHRWLVGKGADMVIAVAQSQRQALVDVVGLPGYKVKWVRGSVNLEKFVPGLDKHLIRDIYNIPHEARVAGMVARMQPHRGHEFFLSTVADVAASVPSAVLAVAGRGEIKNDLVKHIQQHPLRANMRRIGYRKHDLPETYNAMDVVVLLVPGSDGTCRAMLEAMACGRPVIGSRRGAIADSIQHGVTGWLVEPNNRKELAEALIDALSHPEQTAQMGEAARKYVEEHHSRAANQRATYEVYMEALARRCPSAIKAPLA